MCWSFTASIIFTTIGLLVSVYLIRKKDDPYLWIPVIYFSLMELLQVFTYLYLNQCDLPINQLLTYLSYLHITFQPFFMNMVFMHFIPKNVREKIQGYVYAICFAVAICMLIKVYPFAWAKACNIGEALCGTKMCSVSGVWHLGWMIPQKDFGLIFSYIFVIPAFILPFIYGSWRIGVFYLITGPTLAFLITTNPTEWPAIWCLFAILFFLIIFIPKLRKMLYVKKWYAWKYPFMK